MSDILHQIYNTSSFRENGHQLVDFLADYLENALKKEIPVNEFRNVEEQYLDWKNFKVDEDNTISFFKKLAEGSIHLHHPHYMGHQISPPAPVAALAGFFADLINNGMGVYEMGGPSTALEKIVIETLTKAMGYGEEASGFLTSGGTLANLTALLTARSQIKDRNIWVEGYNHNDLAILVSDQAHYCIDRAARILGLGEQGIIKVPTNESYGMDTTMLDDLLQSAEAKGKKILAIIGSACTTSTGSYDDLQAIGDFAHKHGLWFHVDGAHGGAAAFSSSYRYLVKGIEKADSIVIDGHKMMMTPSLITALLFKNGSLSFDTFRQNAQYLFEKELDREWHNLAKRTFECTKLMMSVKMYSILAVYGIKAWDEFVTRLYDNARMFSDLVDTTDEFELAIPPQSNIVCYRKTWQGFNREEHNLMNEAIRKKILIEGQFYIVQTTLNGTVFLRNTMMNPFTTLEDMKRLLIRINEICTELYGSN